MNVTGLLNGRGYGRAPFSDWVAQVERSIYRKCREDVRFDRSVRTALRSCYDVGLSADEVAGDWIDYRAGR